MSSIQNKSIIQELKDEGVLVLYHDYRSHSAIDFSRNDNKGTYSDTSWTGNGLQFPRDDSVVTVLDSSELRLIQGALIVFGDFETQEGPSMFFSKRDPGGINYDFYISGATDLLSFYTGGPIPNLTVDISGKKCLAINFYNGQTCEGFIDGVSAGLFSQSSTISVNDANLLIGNLYTGTGSVDDNLKAAIIINRRLTDTEHARLYSELSNINYPITTTVSSCANLLIDSNEPGLVGGWDMKPVNNIIVDNSLNNNNGTIIPGAVYNNTLLGNSLSFDGISGYIDIGNIAKTVRTVSFWVKSKTTTEDFIDLDGGTHTIEVSGGTVSATGFSTPTIYLDGLVSSSFVADQWYHVVVTTASGFTSNDLDIGRETIYLEGEISNVKLYSDEKSSSWVTKEYNKGQLAFWRTDWGVNESAVNVTSGKLENSDFIIDSGSFKISTNSINGKDIKVIECVTAGVAYIFTDYFKQTPIESAYGSWDFWISHADASTTNIGFITSSVGISSGYGVTIDSSEVIKIVEYGVGDVTSTGGAIVAGTFTKITVTRTKAGLFTLFINDISVDTGTDTTITSASFINLSFGAGDKLIYSDIFGGHSYVKRLTI